MLDETCIRCGCQFGDSEHDCDCPCHDAEIGYVNGVGQDDARREGGA